MTVETNFNQKFLQGGVSKAQGAGRKAKNAIDAVSKTPCAMRFSLGGGGSKCSGE